MPDVRRVLIQHRLAQSNMQTVDPSAGNVHVGNSPVLVQAQDPTQLNDIRKNFMSNGYATPVRLQNGKVVIIAHGAPPQNGQRHWFIGPSANQFGSNDGWLNGEQAKQWAASQGYAGAEFISCYNQGAFDNTGPLEIGVPTDTSSSEFTIKAS
jgi:hypothetical protein